MSGKFNFANIVADTIEKQQDICNTIPDINKLHKKRVQYRNNNIYLNIALFIVSVIVLIIIIIYNDNKIRTTSGIIYIFILFSHWYFITQNNSKITNINNNINTCLDNVKLSHPQYAEPVFDNISIFEYLYNLFTKKGKKYNVVAIAV